MTVPKSRYEAFPPLVSLRVFETIARNGSIRQAARNLGLDHAGVSRHLKELEAWAGVPLMDRSRGARGRLTAAGLRCFARISRALGEIDRAGLDLKECVAAEPLAVYCSHAFASKWLVPRIGGFLHAHPSIEIAVHSTDSPPNLDQPERMIDIRFTGDWMSPRMPPRIEMATLYRPCFIPVVNPGMLAKSRAFTGPDAIKTLPLLFADDFGDWRTWLLRQGCAGGNTLRTVRLGNSLLTIEAAKGGRGVALADELMIADELRMGTLVELCIGQSSLTRLRIGGYTMQGRAEWWNRGPTRDFRRWLRSSMQGKLAHPVSG